MEEVFGGFLRKFFLLVFAFALLLQAAAAKEITVIYNFPAGSHADIVSRVSLAADTNAFTAFVSVASASSLDLNLAFWGDSLGWFVNGVGGLNNNWPGAYWHFWVNGSEAQTGISSFVPANNDTIELGYDSAPLDANAIAFERAINWLASNQKPSGEIGSHAVWGNAFSLMALSLAEDADSVKQKAVDYLLSNQYGNAGFGYPGYGADVGHSAVAILALLSNGKNLNDFDKNNLTTIDYIISNQQNNGGFSSWGSSDIDSTAWTLMALAQAGSGTPAKDGNTPVFFILNAQNTDGGFGYDKSDSSKEDYTAEALLALKAAGQPKNTMVENAINFLNSRKNSSNCLSNAYTTALAAIALNAWGEQYFNLQDCLKTQQLADGGFSRNASAGSNSVDTAIAAIALKGKTLPLSISNTANADNNGPIPLNSIIQFNIGIKNTSRVKANNVVVSLQGLPLDWINNEISTTSFSSILPGETKTTEIYAKLKSSGNYTIKAIVTTDSASNSASSNNAYVNVEEALLNVSLRIA